MSYLDHLKQQAEARQAALHGDAALLAHNAALVEAACAVTWRYLDELGRQLEVLRPVAPARYALDARCVLEGLPFAGFRADLRRKRLAVPGAQVAAQGVEHIVLSARLASGRTVLLTKDFPPEIEKLEARLAQAGIRCPAEPQREPDTGRFIENRYEFVADLLASVRVLPLHDEGRLQFVIHNLDGLSTIKAHFAAHQITTERLDELARWWVGEPQRFLDGAADLRRSEPR